MGELIDKDQEHLRLLSIFQYVYGGMMGLFACLPILHLCMGIAILSGVFPTPPNQPEFPRIFGWLLVGVAGLVIVLGWTLAVLITLAGMSLARRQNRVYCLIIAGLECLFVPLGTILGVFTLIVLLRPSVKELFAGVPNHRSGDRQGLENSAGTS